MKVAILFNSPTLPPEHPDYEQEAGVLHSVASFQAALEESGHTVTQAPLGDSIQPLIDGFSKNRPDVVVNFCEGFRGRSAGEVHVTSLLELLALPYTGCPPECLALVHDKPRCKQLLIGAGVPTSPFVVVSSRRDLDSDVQLQMRLKNWLGERPLFVKPAGEDASLGIDEQSIVSDWSALERQAWQLLATYGPVMVEPYIDGREFNVSVIQLPELEVLPVAEIEFRLSDEFPRPIVTYDSKWATGSTADRATQPRCPANVEPRRAQSITTVSRRAFEATGCRDYARVDLRVDHAGEIFVLEVNANPDAAVGAGLSRALTAAGISHATFVERLVQTAAAR